MPSDEKGSNRGFSESSTPLQEKEYIKLMDLGDSRKQLDMHGLQKYKDSPRVNSFFGSATCVS